MGANQTISGSAEHLDLTGQQVGSYRIIKPLGEGGMGIVYLAHQESPVHRAVALKVIKPGMDSRQVIARFAAERQALAMMDHPSVAKVFEAGSTKNGRPYFAMEYVTGDPITQYCDEHKLTLKERLELFVEVCQAIQHAHQKGIVHRDIKPNNVLVTLQDDRPVAKVIDFGVAKAIHGPLTEKTIYTEQGQLIGTPAYMSPEQASLGGTDVDTRTDVYSLGVLLYELLVGALPFSLEELRAAAFDEMQRRIREEEPQKPSTKLGILEEDTQAAVRRGTDLRNLRRALKSDLDWITMKAMEKDRERRYATASELAVDIQRHLRSEPVLAGPPQALYRVRKMMRRHRLKVAIGVAVVLGLVGGFVLSTWMYLQSEDRRQVEQDRAQEAEVLAESLSEERDKMQQFYSAANAANLFLQELMDRMQSASGSLDITRRDVLREAEREIDANPPGDPQTEAAYREAIGITYRSLGLFEPAEANLRKALDLRRVQLGIDHPDTVHTCANLASVLGSLGRSNEGRELMRLVLRNSTDPKPLQLSQPDIEVEDVPVKPVVALTPRNRTGPPVTPISFARPDRPRSRPPAISRNNFQLACTLYREGQEAKGEELLWQAVDQWQAYLGPCNASTLQAMGHLAEFYLQAERFEDAEEISSDLVSRTEESKDRNPLPYASALNVWGRSLLEIEDLESAEQALLESYNRLHSVYGNHSTKTRAALRSLVKLYDLLEDEEEVDRYLDKLTRR